MFSSIPEFLMTQVLEVKWSIVRNSEHKHIFSKVFLQKGKVLQVLLTDFSQAYAKLNLTICLLHLNFKNSYLEGIGIKTDADICVLYLQR